MSGCTIIRISAADVRVAMREDEKKARLARVEMERPRVIVTC